MAFYRIALGLGFTVLGPACVLSPPAYGAATMPDTLQTCAAIGDEHARLACYDALAGKAATAAPNTPNAPNADFGRPPPPPDKEGQVESRIAGHFDGWTRGQRFTLDNGQVWKVVEDTQAYYRNVPDNPAVKIHTALFGGYVMEVNPPGVRIRVQRVD